MLQDIEPASQPDETINDDGARDVASTTIQLDQGDRHEPAVSFNQLIPVPQKSRPISIKKRRVGHAECLTSSPYKSQLEAMLSSKPKPTRQKKQSTRRSRGPSKKKARQTSVDDNAVDNTPCIFCEIPYNESRVAWWQCRSCSQWACGKCACVGTEKSFVCGTCD